MSDQNLPEPESRLIIRPSTGLVKLAGAGSSAMSEIVNRSLVHIQTSKSLAVPVRHAGEEQEFEIAPGVKIVMCWIPPGDFLMGSPDDEIFRKDDEVQHLVTLTQGFWLGKYQITKAEWEAVMVSIPSKLQGSNLPVEFKSWNDISRSGGFMERVNHLGVAGETFSLPTEAQWEYACRAGTTSALNNGKILTTQIGQCPNLDEVAWYGNNSGMKTHPGGQKKANAWGLHDMHGSMWEWCADWHGCYTDKPLVNPRGPISGSHRVVRGGSWGGIAYSCRVAFRGSNSPTYYSNSLGFRLARSSVPQ